MLFLSGSEKNQRKNRLMGANKGQAHACPLLDFFSLWFFVFKRKEGTERKKTGYFVMTVPALPASASTALSSEVMIARRPGLDEANFMAA